MSGGWTAGWTGGASLDRSGWWKFTRNENIVLCLDCGIPLPWNNSKYDTAVLTLIKGNGAVLDLLVTFSLPDSKHGYLTLLHQMHITLDSPHNPIHQLILPIINELEPLIDILKGLEYLLITEDGQPNGLCESRIVPLFELVFAEDGLLVFLEHERLYDLEGAGCKGLKLGLGETDVAAWVLREFVAHCGQSQVEFALVELDGIVDFGEVGVGSIGPHRVGHLVHSPLRLHQHLP
jgi:hypothetical protein